MHLQSHTAYVCTVLVFVDMQLSIDAACCLVASLQVQLRAKNK